MWGNSLGWFLSAISVAATVIFLGWLNSTAERAADRTDFSKDPRHAALIDLPLPLTLVVPSMTQPGDAAPIYRKAISAAQAQPLMYESFARNGQARDIELVPAIQLLAEATPLASANLFRDHPAEVIAFTNELPALDSLVAVGHCARRAAELIQKDQPAEAMKLYEASFSLGAKLYKERLCWRELDAGLTLMAGAAVELKGLCTTLGNTDRAAAIDRFDSARRLYVAQQLLPVQRVISTIDPDLNREHPGDVIYFARHAQDRMWRVEAIFKLARYRFDASRLGDQRTAMKVIEELTNDPDPVIQAAAVAARDLTIERYRMMH